MQYQYSYNAENTGNSAHRLSAEMRPLRIDSIEGCWDYHGGKYMPGKLLRKIKQNWLIYLESRRDGFPF